MQFVSDLGLELSVFVCHLYAKYSEEPLKAFHELVLRTRSSCCGSDDSSNYLSLATLSGTQWYQDMTKRYASLRQRLRGERDDDVQEAREVTVSLYPQGCRVSEYADAIVTSAAMLTSNIPSTVLERFASCRVKDLNEKGCVSISADELASDLIERPVLDSFTPSRWWESDNTAPSSSLKDELVAVKSIGLRVQPVEILIFYTYNGRPRRRFIPLDGLLHENSPIAPLLRRLVRSHGMLVSESQLRSYLQRLQELMRKSVESHASTVKPEGPLQPQFDWKQQIGYSDNASAAHNTGEEEQHMTSAKTVEPEVNKADVGLLYRDPEAALKNVDLNDADDITLQEFKAKMNEGFMQNALRPGDPGYVYDKRLDVNPTERSEWDDSD